jgi:hypothetical protein
MLRLSQPLAAEAQQGVFFVIRPIVAPESRICQWPRDDGEGSQVTNHLKLASRNRGGVPAESIAVSLCILTDIQLPLCLSVYYPG